MKAIKTIYCGLALLLAVTCLQVLVLSSVYAVNGYSVMSLSNGERAAMGVQGLTYNSSLAYAAQLRAQDMIDNDYWSHTSPGGRSMGYFLGAAGYPVYTAGENLSRGYSDDGGVVSAWMASAGHRATILNSAYTEIGVGFADGMLGDEYTTVVVAYYAATGPVYTPPPVPVSTPTPPPVASAPTVRQVVNDSTPQPKVEAEVVAETVVSPVSQPEPVAAPDISEPIVAAQATAGLPSITNNVETENTPARSVWGTVLYVFHYFQMLYTIKHGSLFAIV